MDGVGEHLQVDDEVGEEAGGQEGRFAPACLRALGLGVQQPRQFRVRNLEPRNAGIL